MREWKNILFLGNDNTYLSRFAEEYFNQYALRYGLEVKAVSRGMIKTRRKIQMRKVKEIVIKELNKRGLLPIQADRPAKSLAWNELTEFDHIYVMAKEQRKALLKLYPHLQKHIDCLDIKEQNEGLPEIELEKLSVKLDDLIN